MADFAAGKRYAQAAFAIARDGGTVAQWRRDLHDIASVLSESDAAPLFVNERLPLDRRQDMASRILDVQPLAMNLARLLIARGRSGDARAVADAFDRLADEYEGIARATITTAVDLSPVQVEGIESQLGASLNKRVFATARTDPSIIGGVVVRVGDRLIDGSVTTRLKRLRRELLGAR